MSNKSKSIRSHFAPYFTKSGDLKKKLTTTQMNNLSQLRSYYDVAKGKKPKKWKPQVDYIDDPRDWKPRGKKKKKWKPQVDYIDDPRDFI